MRNDRTFNVFCRFFLMFETGCSRSAEAAKRHDVRTIALCLVRFISTGFACQNKATKVEPLLYEEKFY